MGLQYINDSNGNPEYVVLSVKEYEELLNDRDIDVKYKPSHDDDTTIPNDVVQIMVRDDISLLAAWRIYRGLSQYEVAATLETTQSAVSQLEGVKSKPQKRTRERLAKLYNCLPEQLIL